MTVGGTVAARYTYDPLDRRIGIQDNGIQTWVVWDGQQPYADFNGSGALQERYLYGPAVDEILARTDSVGTTSWYLTDREGSVRNLADSSGTVTGTITYDGFGKQLGSSGAVDRFGYTGREYDPTTGLQYNRERYYDAALGRWTQEDKIGFAGGDPNLERYVGNSPTNFSDPSGRGLTSLIYTGQWNPAANVWDAAMEAAGPAYTKRYNDQAESATIVLSVASQAPGAAGVLATVVNVAYVTVLNPSITPYDGPLLAAVSPKGRPILIGRPVPRGPAGSFASPKPTPCPANVFPKGNPKPSPNFLEPTNPPQNPPTSTPPGHTVRIGPPAEQYPNG